MKSLLVERRTGGSGLPKAHIVSPRSMEILAQCGIARTHVDHAGAHRKAPFRNEYAHVRVVAAARRAPRQRMIRRWLMCALDQSAGLAHHQPQPVFRLIRADYRLWEITKIDESSLQMRAAQTATTNCAAAAGGGAQRSIGHWHRERHNSVPPWWKSGNGRSAHRTWVFALFAMTDVTAES